MSYESRKADVFAFNEAANRLTEEISNLTLDDESRRGRLLSLVGEIQEALIRVYDASEAELKESEDRKVEEDRQKDVKRPVVRK